MRIIPNFFVSLLLTSLMSFAAPIILVGFAWVSLSLASYLPGFMIVGKQGAIYIGEFLTIFGSGKPLQGTLILGLTVSLVGILLDLLNFYRYQSLRH